jgi:hypothetical protein
MLLIAREWHLLSARANGSLSFRAQNASVAAGFCSTRTANGKPPISSTPANV